jgi:hypothetical protein
MPGKFIMSGKDLPAEELNDVDALFGRKSGLCGLAG